MPKRKLTERLRRNLHPHEVQDALQERFEAADEIERLREALQHYHDTAANWSDAQVAAKALKQE